MNNLIKSKVVEPQKYDYIKNTCIIGMDNANTQTDLDSRPYIALKAGILYLI